MTKDEAYKMGRADGEGHALYGEMSLEDYERHLRDDTLGEPLGEIIECFRQYSPFEFTAKAFNDAPNRESLWAAYDNGEYRGWIDGLKKRFASTRKQ